MILLTDKSPLKATPDVNDETALPVKQIFPSLSLYHSDTKKLCVCGEQTYETRRPPT